MRMSTTVCHVLNKKDAGGKCKPLEIKIRYISFVGQQVTPGDLRGRALLGGEVE